MNPNLNSSFLENVSAAVPATGIVVNGGLAAIPWATAVALSGRPRQEVVVFPTGLVRPIFGGGVVAVDMPVGDRMQRTWLPVMDNDNDWLPVAQGSIDPWLTVVASNRCRAKAIAMVTGYGLSLYASHGVDGKGFVESLGVGEADSPEKAVPCLAKRDDGVDYLEWTVALAVARLFDQNFHWQVVEFGEQPYLQVNGGIVVAVQVSYLDRSHTEYLPIMDPSNQAIAEPNAADWNKSVMRCLAKAIAVTTGYGLRQAYAREDGGEDSMSPTGTAEEKKPEVASNDASKLSDDDRATLSQDVADLLAQNKRTVQQLATWLGKPAANDLSDLSDAELLRAKSALTPRKVQGG